MLCDLDNDDDVFVLIGSYVGPEVAAVDVLLSARDCDPSPALCGLFSASCPSHMLEGEDFNCLSGVTRHDVNSALMDKKIVLSCDQEDYVEEVGTSRAMRDRQVNVYRQSTDNILSVMGLGRRMDGEDEDQEVEWDPIVKRRARKEIRTHETKVERVRDKTSCVQ